MNSYDAGTSVRISVAFTDTNNNAGDPGAVTCALSKPDGTTLAPTPTRDGTGLYHADVDTSGGPGGVWSYRFTGTSPLAAVSDGTFYVKALGF